MLLCGSVSIQNRDYLFYRIEDVSRLCTLVFSPTAVIDGVEYQINTADFIDGKTKSLGAFLVGGSDVSVSDYSTFGNPYYVAEINRNLNIALQDNYESPETSDIVDPEKKSISVFSFEGHGNSCYLKYSKRKSKTDSAGVYNYLEFKTPTVELVTGKSLTKGFKILNSLGVSWDSMDLVNDNKAIRFQESSIAVRAKTLNQLRIERDLSFYYKSNGTPRKEYIAIEDMDTLKYYCEEVFPNVEYWAVDIESTGLNMYEGDHPEHMDHIVSIMMAWKKDHALFLPFDMEYFTNLPEEAWELLKPWLEKIPCGGHNIGFDARGVYTDTRKNVVRDKYETKLWHTKEALREKGIELNVHDDTQILNFNLNTYRAKHRNGLKYLEHKYLGVDTLELKDIFGTNKYAGLYRWLPRELALIYACPDVDMWLQLFEILWKMLPVSCRAAYRLDMRTLKHIWKSDMTGNKIDVIQGRKLRDINNRDRDTIKELIFRHVGQQLAFKGKMAELNALIDSNEIDYDIYERELTEFIGSEKYSKARYEFKISSAKVLASVMYDEDKLGYPILAYTKKDNSPAVSADALSKLLDIKAEAPTGALKQDVESGMKEVDPKESVLIEANKFNSLQFPLALLITEWRLRDKRDSTFFAALLDKSIDGFYYTQSKMANAETFRIINTVQVLQGVMKKLVIPFDIDWYMLVFDFSQIEYRHMAGLAKVISLVKNLNRYRADFHTECCALLYAIQTWLVTKTMRSAAKSLNFAIPYGMGIASIAENLFKKVNNITKIKAQRQLNTWYEKFHQIKTLLDGHREFALDNGYVVNELGRRRYFFMNEEDSDVRENTLKGWKRSITKGRRKAIERAAGNYPIQSGAADLFKISFCQFRDRLEAEGIDHLVKTTALVHDEIVSSIHRSINPYFLYKIIWEECMLSIKGHPRYFAGVSIVDNWYEGKADLYEAPIEFVEYILKSGKADEKFGWYEDPKNMVLNDIKEYMSETYYKEFLALGVDCKSDTVDVAKLIDNLTDYFLRGKMALYFNPLSKPMDAKVYENDVFIRGVESYVLSINTNKEVKFIYPEDYPMGQVAYVSTKFRKFTDKEEVFEVVNDIDIDLDNLDLTSLFDTDDSDSMDSIDLLKLIEEDEMDDNGFSADDYVGGPIYFTYKFSQNEEEDELERFEKDPSEFIKLYEDKSSKVIIETKRIILDVTETSIKDRKETIKYCSSIAVDKGVIGSKEIVFRFGSQYKNTGTFVQTYSLDKLKELVGEVNVANC